MDTCTHGRCGMASSAAAAAASQITHTGPRSPGMVASMHAQAGRESCRAEQGQGEQGEQGKDRRGRDGFDVGP